MGSAWQGFTDDTLDFFQFFHKVVTGMKATGGIHQHDIHIPGHGSLNAIECNRSRICVLLPCDHR
jgi:hypothetical protein